MLRDNWNAGGIKMRDITAQCTFSWATAPTAATAGTFPDSFIDGNHETKLEFYGTYAGAGVQAKLQVLLPKPCTFEIHADIGVGAQIGTDNSAKRSTHCDMSIISERIPAIWSSFLTTHSDPDFSIRLRKSANAFPTSYGDAAALIFHSSTAGDYAWEIYSIRILELVGV